MRWVIMLIGMLLLFSCQEEPCKCEIEPDQMRYSENVLEVDSVREGMAFFSPKHWESINEPELWDLDHEIYRLFIRQAFRKGHRVYRLERKGNRCTLTINIELEKANWMPEDSLSAESFVKEIPISLEEWESFTHKIDSVCYWKTLPWNGMQVLDGSSWILEAYNPNKNACTQKRYHLVGRRSPDMKQDAAFLTLCKTLYRYHPPNRY